MIYGLYLSASGMVANTRQQDIVANNLANIDTNGFKRALSTLQARPPERETRPDLRHGDASLDIIGGGTTMRPTDFDTTAGAIELTNRPLDAAINGEGYFAVRDPQGITRLTRNGSFQLDPEGKLVLATDGKSQLLDVTLNPIQFEPGITEGQLSIASDGAILLGETPITGLAVVNTPTPLIAIGGTLLSAGPEPELLPTVAEVESKHLEKSNVDPATELTRMMEIQRQLEANANIIRTLDQTLAKAVGEVGKIA